MDWQLLNLLGLEITGDHARLVVTLLGAAIGVLGFTAGRWSKHRSRVRFKREDLVTTSIVIELYGILARPDGTEMLDIVTQGGSATVDSFFYNTDLVGHIRRAAAKHPGLLQLSNPVAHRMMMHEGEDKITGLDSRANMDLVKGRPTRDDQVLIAFAAYRENAHAENGLKDQVSRLVQMVVSPDLVERLADPAYIERLQVIHAGYRPRRDRLQDLAREWQRLQALPAAERSAGRDRIWQVIVHSAAG